MIQHEKHVEIHLHFSQSPKKMVGSDGPQLFTVLSNKDCWGENPYMCSVDEQETPNCDELSILMYKGNASFKNPT